MQKKQSVIFALTTLATSSGQAAVILDPDGTGANYYENQSSAGETIGSPEQYPLAPNHTLLLGGTTPGTLEVNADNRYGATTQLQRSNIVLYDQAELRVIGNGIAGSAKIELAGDENEPGSGLATLSGSTVKILNGGQITSADNQILAIRANQQGGMITVDGSGSLLSAHHLSIGEETVASDSSDSHPLLTISNGAIAAFTNTAANLFYVPLSDNDEPILEYSNYLGTPYDTNGTSRLPGQGEILVTDSGSQLNMDGDLLISNGSLKILDGAIGNIAAIDMNRVDSMAETAEIVVRGENAQLNIGSSITIGSHAEDSSGNYGGSITISDAGLLTAESINLNNNALLFGDNGTIAADVMMNGGSIAPGESSVGSLTIEGDLDWAAGLLEIDIASQKDFDQLHVLGNTTLGADSQVIFNFVDDFMPQVGDMFEFLLTDSLLGDLSLLNYVLIGLDSKDLALRLVETDAGFALYTANGATVPLPAGIWLFLAGITAAFSLGKTRKQMGLKAA